jgi:cbb3-type cytochrome oxidase subunit 3
VKEHTSYKKGLTTQFINATAMSQQYTVWLNGTEWVINSKPPLYDQPAHPSPDSTLVIIAGIVLVLCFIVPACLHCYRPSARHRFAAERTAEQDDEGLKEITKQIEMHIFRMSKVSSLDTTQLVCINQKDESETSLPNINVSRLYTSKIFALMSTMTNAMQSKYVVPALTPLKLIPKRT